MPLRKDKTTFLGRLFDLAFKNNFCGYNDHDYNEIKTITNKFTPTDMIPNDIMITVITNKFPRSQRVRYNRA